MVHIFWVEEPNNSSARELESTSSLKEMQTLHTFMPLLMERKAIVSCISDLTSKQEWSLTSGTSQMYLLFKYFV
jgi:hypothetical protein